MTQAHTVERSPGRQRSRGRLALVCSRFGSDVTGGAEALMRELGIGLRARGWEIDAIAGAARDHSTWEDDLRVLRFRTVTSRDARDRDRIGQLISVRAPVSLTDQYRWMNGGVRVPGMYEYLVDTARRYRAILLSPYLFWTTFACAEIAAERSILIPSLHDEPPAYLDIFKPMFEGSRGIWFQTEPEMELARQIFQLPRHVTVMGQGIHPPAGYDVDGFRRRHGVEGDFILFAGRRDCGKSWPDLLAHLRFANSVLPRPVPLVTCGAGELGAVPANVRVVDLGLLPDAERSDAMAAAAVSVQPSALESFSRTIMEAWLAETPVLANAGSAVVSWHCSRSRAGLLYQDRYEFAEGLRLLLQDRALSRVMGRRGRAYVSDNYRWDRVLDRAERSLEEWT